MLNWFDKQPKFIRGFMVFIIMFGAWLSALSLGTLLIHLAYVAFGFAGAAVSILSLFFGLLSVSFYFGSVQDDYEL